jgi:spore coat protein U-like protein
MGTRPCQTAGRFKRRFTLRAIGVAGITMLGLSLPTAAAAQTTQQGQGQVNILRPLSFFKVDDLDFGDIVAGTNASVIRIQPNGTRTVVSGNATLAGSSGQPARFTGLGTFNQQVDINVSANTIQLIGPGAPMTVSQFEIGSTPTAILTTTPRRFRITGAGGIYAFPVGARLAVGANQTPGVYTGTFSITLNYL